MGGETSRGPLSGANCRETASRLSILVTNTCPAGAGCKIGGSSDQAAGDPTREKDAWGEGRVDFPTPPAAHRRIRPRRASTITTSKNVRTPI
jgi:phage tail tape-measure protein